jgi:peptidoglycan-N-acetylglucosamine deacetylase
MVGTLYNAVVAISVILLVVVLCKLIFFITLASRHQYHHTRRSPRRVKGTPPLVSVIVPAHNEGPTLENCIRGLQLQTYRHCEIVIVDNASTDNTGEIANRFAEEFRYVRVVSESRLGKANALNTGIKAAWGGIVVCVDADSILKRNAVEQLVLSMSNPEVVAVGGNVRVANRHHAFGMQQAVEYITGLTLQRRTFAHLNCMQVISGAIGAFRKQAILDVGGYSLDTVVEDMDITITLARRGGRIVFNPHAIAYTEAPETIGDFVKQRYRWTYGGFQVALKHRDIIFRPAARTLGMIGMPYFVIFPWVDAFISLMLVFSLVRALLTGDGFGLLFFFVFMCFLQAAAVFYALHLDKESKKLLLVATLDNIFYNHLISFVTVRAGLNFARRRSATWHKLQRYGKNQVPEPAGSD